MKLSNEQRELVSEIYNGYNELVASLDIIKRRPNMVESLYDDEFRDYHIGNLQKLYFILEDVPDEA
jgi:hypothetical protein